jgi:hypothetical protein
MNISPTTAITGGGDAQGEGSASDVNGMTQAAITGSFWRGLGFSEDVWNIPVYGAPTLK